MMWFLKYFLKVIIDKLLHKLIVQICSNPERLITILRTLVQHGDKYKNVNHYD